MTERGTDGRPRRGLSALRALCRSLDGRGYPGYRQLAGSFDLGDGALLFLDRIQGDPFAPPSRGRLRLEAGRAGFAPDLGSNRIRRAAFEDHLARRTRAVLESREAGRSAGSVRIDAGGQQVLERSAVRSTSEFIEARLEIGLPGDGRRIAGRRAEKLLADFLPGLAADALAAPDAKADAEARAFVEAVENQEHLRAQLPRLGLVAFVADGAVLPRASGASDEPLAEAEAVRFESPETLRTTLRLLHPLDDGREEVVGMGVPEGVTLIAGGGFHGKTTLLRALGRAVVPHVPGDGRDLVATRRDAVAIRAEQGRPVLDVDISPFIRDLPGGRPTAAFRTGNASGSTSQAAAIVEALEAGSRLLLIDEDTAATNLMVRDARMQALIAPESEPIVPLVDRVRELWEERGVSTVLVIGGCGDYLDAADAVIQFDAYRPRDAASKAREVAARFPTGRSPDQGGGGFGRSARIPVAKSYQAIGRRGTPRIRARRPGALEFGQEEVDLGGVEQLFDASQTRAAGHAAALASSEWMDGRTIGEVLDAVEERLDARGVDSLTPEGARGAHPGLLARPRRHEIAAVMNRVRSGRFRIAPADREGDAP